MDLCNSYKKQRIITYFPGTRSHARDFAEIAQPLSNILQSNTDIKLQITGPLEYKINVSPAQSIHYDRVPFSEYNTLVKNGWINLAPLEINPFTRCKSAIKIIEAGYWGIPTICSANPDNMRFIGVGALLSSTPQEWIANIERLYDPLEYQRLTHELKQRILTLANVDNQSQRLIQFAASLAR